MQKRIKICAAASAGGHLSQLLKLTQGWSDYETCYITTSDAVRDKLSKLGKTYVVGECNRERPIKVLKVIYRCLAVILKERPNVLISTGAAAGCIACFAAKLLGAKVIWIDSITNVNRLSLSGRMVRYTADLFLVQWPDLAKKYKKAAYVGAVV
jgi:UDP-N-acetylglucosamine:LPS N-acetylglucosamine transferase